METLLKKRRKALCLKRFNEANKKLKSVVDLLYREGASEILLFGSITIPERFTERSDIDIAVRGVSEDKRFLLEGRIADLFGDIGFDILFLEDEMELRKEILEKIRTEAIAWSH